MTQSQQVQNCIKSINVTWLLITVWHFIVVVDKDMKSCPKQRESRIAPSNSIFYMEDIFHQHIKVL